MRLVGAMIVRDEEDIVEASVRHNLRFLDSLAVVDHGSSDATGRILASLAAEGLPLEITQDATLAFAPAPMTTSLVRRALAAGGDLVIPIDADEFVRLPSRDALEKAVRDADPETQFALPVQTFAPDFTDEGDIVAALRHAKRRRDEPVGNARAIATPHLLEPPDASFDPGRREILRGRTPPGARRTLPASTAAVARVPVRSVEQFVASVTVGYLARLLAPSDPIRGRDALGDAYAAIIAGRLPTREGLDSLVANDGVAREPGAEPDTASWVEDGFVSELELRYTPAGRTVPIARVLAFGERVAKQIALSNVWPAKR